MKHSFWCLIYYLTHLGHYPDQGFVDLELNSESGFEAKLHQGFCKSQDAPTIT